MVAAAVVLGDRMGDPTDNALVINFRVSSDAEITLINTGRAHKIGAKTCKNVACNVYRIPTDVPFCMPPLVVGGGSDSARKEKKNNQLSKSYSNCLCASSIVILMWESNILLQPFFVIFTCRFHSGKCCVRLHLSWHHVYGPGGIVYLKYLRKERERERERKKEGDTLREKKI